MTRGQAEAILAKPRFGDKDCIEAVKRLEAEPEIQRLRDFVTGKYIACGACGGTSDGCNICDPEGMVKIPRELAEAWDLDTLKDVAEEIGVER